jgi:hypothetical protein
MVDPLLGVLPSPKMPFQRVSKSAAVRLADIQNLMRRAAADHIDAALSVQVFDPL